MSLEIPGVTVDDPAASNYSSKPFAVEVFDPKLLTDLSIGCEGSVEGARLVLEGAIDSNITSRKVERAFPLIITASSDYQTNHGVYPDRFELTIHSGAASGQLNPASMWHTDPRECAYGMVDDYPTEYAVGEPPNDDLIGVKFAWAVSRKIREGRADLFKSVPNVLYRFGPNDIHRRPTFRSLAQRMGVLLQLWSADDNV